MNFNTVLLEVHSTFCDQREHLGVQPVFFHFDPGAQRGLVVIGEHGRRTLCNDGPGVHAFVDQVDRATGQRRPGCQHVSMSVSAGEMRQKGGVDVDDTAAPSREEMRRQQTHVAGENDQFHIVVLQSVKDVGFVLLP